MKTQLTDHSRHALRLGATSSDVTPGTITLYDVNLAATYEPFRFGGGVATAAHLRTEVGQTGAKGTAGDAAKTQIRRLLQ